MSLTAAMIRKLAEKGFSPEEMAEFAEMMEEGFAKPVPSYELSPGAIRTRKWREKKEAERHGDVTVTSRGDDQPLSLPPSPQTPQPPTHTRVRDITTRVREAFARWWAAYPRKVGKEDAWRKYQIAARKIGDDFEAVLIGGLERAKAAWTDAQFIPHPATWLHQGRWEDEPTVINLAPRQTHAQRPDTKRTAREANYDRALAGAEAAARARAERG